MPISRAARSAAASAASALALAGALAGCTSASQVPTVAFPSATVPQVYAPSPVPVATYTGYAPPFDAVTTTISGLSADTVLKFPMGPVPFSVTLTNTSSYAFKSIEPLIVLASCTCNPKDYDLAPHTTVEFYNATTGAWQTIEAADMDSSGSYKNWNEVPEVDIPAQGSVTLKYRMKLAKSATLVPDATSGSSALDVFVLQEPGRTRLSVGSIPDATASLTYSIN